MFKDFPWVYDLWSSNEGFIDMIGKFNQRKQFYITYGQEAFIQFYYNVAHERFFQNADGDGIYSMLVRMPGMVDLAPLIDNFPFNFQFCRSCNHLLDTSLFLTEEGLICRYCQAERIAFDEQT